MSDNFLPAHVRSLLAVMLLLGPALLSPVGTSHPVPVLGEEFYDTAFPGWSWSGVPAPTFDAVNGWSGASMSITMSGSFMAQRTYTRTVSGVGIVSSPLFEFAWNGGAPHGTGANVDSWVTWTFTNGASVEFQPTALGQNDQPLLRVSTAAGDLHASSLYRIPTGLPWTWAPQTWYRSEFTHDVTAMTVTGRVYDATGALVAFTDPASLPGGAGSVEKFQVAAANPVSGTNTFRYDSFYFHPAGTPSKPHAVAVQAGPQSGQLRVTWNTPLGGAAPTSYHVYRGPTMEAATLHATVTASDLFFIDTDLGEGARWFYKVQAENAAGDGPFSASSDATTWSRPAAPTSLSVAQGPGVGQIRLTWQAPTNGGTPITAYRIHRGTTSGGESLLTEISPATTWTDSTLPNGTRFYYRVSAVNAVGDGPLSSEVNQLPKPDAVTGPAGLTVTPTRVWTGDAMTVNFTYTVTATQCVATETCPVTNEWRVLLDGAAGTAGGTLLASGTNTHAGHAQPETYTVAVPVNPATTDGAHAVRVAVTARSGNDLWQYATQGVTIDAPLPGQLTSGPQRLILAPTILWSGETLSVESAYSVIQKQCNASDTCPVTNEWQVVLDGQSIMTSGSNQHAAHGENTTYTLDQSFVVPLLTSGTHVVTVSARPDPSAPWTNTSAAFILRNTTSWLPIPDTVCDSNPSTYTYLAPRTSATNFNGRGFPKSFSYITQGSVSPFRAMFYDGCDNPQHPNGDGVYEFGRGGLLLNRTLYASHMVQVLDASGVIAPFFIGSDRDGSGTVGDTPLDCIRGPFEVEATLDCPADPDGNVVIFLPNLNPVDTGSEDITWGRVSICVAGRCFPIQTYDATYTDPYEDESDSDHDGMGTGWEQQKNEDAKRIDELLDALMDQEFASPCSTNCPGMPRTGDGLTNLMEFRWLTIPIGPLRVCPTPMSCYDLLGNARDNDTDNWEDGPEVKYWNDPKNDPTLDNPTWALRNAAPLDSDRAYDPDGDGKGTVGDRDSDNDGLLDGEEYNTWRTFPELSDSDCEDFESRCDGPKPNRFDIKNGTHNGGDRINDSAEKLYWTTDGRSATRNIDRDAITNNLLDPDSDGDHVLDGDEIHCALPCLALMESRADDYDTDNDGLLDGPDQQLLPTDPRTSIFAGANVAHIRTSGGYYYFYGENRALQDTFRNDTDSDNDCLPDGWEIRYQLNPLDPADANDTMAGDEDGLSPLAEYNYLRTATTCDLALLWSGLDPTLTDTDLDGLHDGDEVGIGSNPKEPDTDLDGLQDGAEVHQHGTNATRRDTDGEGLSDYQEIVTYAAKNVSATNPNSDWCCTDTEPNNKDILTDYEEIIQYRTNTSRLDMNGDGRPDGWDTDADGLGDGWDSNPTRYDSPPVPKPSPSPMPAPGPEDAYAVVRQHYLDVMVRDAHGNEANIAVVDIRVNFTGTVNGAPKWVVVHHDAYRLDDGQAWGVRIPLPEGMSASSRQDFSLTIVGVEGNVRTYTKTFQEPMSADPAWSGCDPEMDPDPTNGGWENFYVHRSDGETPAGTPNAPEGPNSPQAPPVGGGDPPLDPFSMTLEQLFATYGEFKVYRLKPFALTREELLNATNASAFGILEPLSVTLGLNDSEAADLSLSFSVSLYRDAFELIDPSQELGPYQSTAGGGNSYFRAPKWLRVGVEKTWKATAGTAGFIAEEAVAQGASFVFGSDDPRAKGRIAGDIVAGILVYGDVRDVVVGVAADQPWKTVLGGVGIALTWVGPGADGPYSAFKAGAKLIASVPVAGPKLVVKMATDIRDQAKLLKEAVKNGEQPLGEAAGTALRFVADEADVALWASRNTAKVPELELVKKTLPATTVHALKEQLDNVVDAAADLTRVYGDTTATALLKRFTEPSVMYPAGGADALREVSEISAVVRQNAGQTDPDRAAFFLNDLDTLRDAPNVNAWWHQRAKTHIVSPDNDGWFGYVFEAEQGARLKGEGKLAWLDDKLEGVVVGGNPPRDVQVDFYRTGSNGKKILTDAKSGDVTRATEDNRVQMEAQVAAVLQHEQAEGLAREIHWVVEGRVTQPLAQHAANLYGNYGVTVKFFDRQGNQIMNYFPE